MIKSVSIVLHKSQNLTESLKIIHKCYFPVPRNCNHLVFFSILNLSTFLCFFRLLVRQSGKLLHIVSRLHFVDSPEWFGVVADDLFQVNNYRKRANNRSKITTIIIYFHRMKEA